MGRLVFCKGNVGEHTGWSGLVRSAFGIFWVRGCGLEMLVRVEAFSQPLASISIRWVTLHCAPGSSFCFVGSFQGRVDIRKLKVRVSKFGLVGNDFLQRCNGRLKITFVDVALGFIEKVV